MQKTIKETTILIGLAVVLAFIVNFLSPFRIAMIGQWNTDQGVITANASKYELLDELEINNVMIAKEIHDSGTALFVDARQRGSFDDGHIPGAVSLPVGRFDDHIDSFMSEYLPVQPIVVYCSGRTCEDSHQLAQLLIGFGFTDVRVFIDGFPGWESKGYDVEYKY